MRHKEEKDKATDNIFLSIFGFKKILPIFLFMLIIPFVSSINYSNSVVLGFNFSNNSATQYDLTGHNFQGNLSGTYVINSTDCVKDSCIYLGGSNNGLMRVNSPSNVLLSNDFGISVWVKLSAIENLDTLLHTSALSNAAPYYNLEGDGSSRITVINGTAYTNILSTAINNNTWIHLFFTVNGDNSSIYVNGELKSSSNTGKFYTSGMFKELDFFNNRNAPSRGINGWVDEYYIFNSSLSPSIIEYIYENNLSYPFVIPDNIELYDKKPSDIDTENAVYGINITYNYNFPNVNTSTIKLNYTIVNSSNGTIYSYVNGTQQDAFRYFNYTSNNSSNYLFILDDVIYPATYNMDHNLMSNSTHYNYTLTNRVQGLKVQLFNVSAKQYDILEVSIQTSSPTTFGNIYYCNSSYTTGKVSTSHFCSLISSTNITTCDHTHINSCHNTFPIKILNGLYNNITITPTSYFIIMGSNIGNVNIGYVNQSVRSGLAQLTINDGVSYSNLAITPDLHLHYYNSNDSILYFAQGYNTSGTLFKSSISSDVFDISRFSPSVVNAYTNKNNYYYNDTINIIRTNSSTFSDGYISSYDFLLYSFTNSSKYWNISLNTNNSIVNITAYNLSNDYYYFEIIATDNYSLESYSFSNVFYVSTFYNGTCNETITLNSTGVPVYLDALKNEMNDSVSYLFERNNLTAFFTTDSGITLFDTTDIYNGDYFIKTRENLDSYTYCNISFCRNDWERTTEACIDNLRLINYTDLNNCPDIYEIPNDVNTFEDCVLPSDTDKELWLIIIFISIWLICIVLSLLYAPLIMIGAFLSGVGFLYYSNIYFENNLAGVILLMITVIITFISMSISRE